MPIPEWNLAGVVPPFTGTDGESRANRAPWKCTMFEFAQRFCTSRPRQRHLLGLLALRADIRGAGFRGVQWVNGSFIEDCQARRARSPEQSPDDIEPGDIDVLTIFQPPTGILNDELFEMVRTYFDGPTTKSRYGCDSFPLSLRDPPMTIARLAAYWFGLFSHAKTDGAHKGPCEIVLDDRSDDDAAAREYVSAWSDPNA